jgi:hypothetical protein
VSEAVKCCHSYPSGVKIPHPLAIIFTLRTPPRPSCKPRVGRALEHAVGLVSLLLWGGVAWEDGG